MALPQLSLSAGLGACRSTFENDVLSASADELGVDVSAAHVWDFSSLSVSFGGLAAASWLRQRFSTAGLAPNRDSLGLGVGALVAASVELSEGYHVFGEGLGQVLFFEQRRSGEGDSMQAKPAFRITLGGGKHF